MNTYTFKFQGYYPVGAVGLVVADNLELAKALVHKRLETMGLKQELKNSDFKLQDNSTRRVDILLDGDY